MQGQVRAQVHLSVDACEGFNFYKVTFPVDVYRHSQFNASTQLKSFCLQHENFL